MSLAPWETSVNRTLRLLGITATAGIVALSLPGVAAQAHAETSTAAPNCSALAKYYDAVPRPDLGKGIVRTVNVQIAQATYCLINAERAKAGLPALKWNEKLHRLAVEHARAAVKLKWWKDGADPHKNPVTGSTPESRIRGAGYCANGRSWSVAEIAYTDWGGRGTPRAAVRWWMNSDKHRPHILSRTLTEIGGFAIGGAADPKGANATDAGTYVMKFGSCR
ncbi:hypothetical protein GCM10010106_46800 [Thermopolyspora flexuosa]|jgi:uncharacterized protein YkwD|uniref:Uncharacterized protein YkwD n=1 Tax=Thermopolyspora flexuosa TaxID=103836 RepID=A0A543IWL1_9ACTN|nr:uncharacterized protein YkwD [Thermopolyspora flexuosa]GGM93114.1 hypothetical protein GCM10010106_46800 [Thermopolyspora flexuosa]